MKSLNLLGILLKRGTKNKYEAPYKGPFAILKVNDNGTVHLQAGAVEDTINIRRLTPYTSASTADASNHGENAVCHLLI